MVIDLGFLLYPLIGVYLVLGIVVAMVGHSIFKRALQAAKLLGESTPLRAAPQPVRTNRRAD